MRFEENLERNIMQLYRELNDATWSPSRLSCFVVTHPRPREIWASDFRDRIVQYVFYNRWRDRFHNCFIYDTYACIPGRGALRGAQRVSQMMRKASNNFQREAFIMKADFANFFVSINKEILEDILFRKITTPWDRWIASKILWTDVKQNALIKSGRSLLHKVPKHKSLFHAPCHKGLPIGNLTSQFFANTYLNELDQFMKHQAKSKYYGRYVDDIVIVASMKDQLTNYFREASKFSSENLDIGFHPNKTVITKVAQGVNFVGYIILPYRKYLRRSILSNLMVKTENKAFISSNKVKASVNSYLGMLRHVNGYKARKKICQRLNWLGYPSDKALIKLLS